MWSKWNSPIVGDNVKVSQSREVSSKVKHIPTIPYDLASPLLGTCPKDPKPPIHRKAHNGMSCQLYSSI